MPGEIDDRAQRLMPLHDVVGCRFQSLEVESTVQNQSEIHVVRGADAGHLPGAQHAQLAG